MATSATVAKLNIHVGATSFAVASGLAAGETALTAFNAKVKAIAFSWQAMVAGLAAAAGVSWGVRLAAEAETAQVSFEVMIGSVEKANKLLGDLRAFAVETPFEFPELRQAAGTLLAMGIEADNVMRTMRTLGDVASGTAQPLNELASVFGQVAVAGRLTGGELRQFNERGVPLLEALSRQLGVTKQSIRDMVEAGQISFEMVERAFESMAGEGGRFQDLMARQSQTLAGRWSTLKDTAGLLAMSVGEALAPALKNLIELVIPLLESFNALDKTQLQNILRITAWIAALVALAVIVPKIVAAINAIIAAYRAMAIAKAIVLALEGPAGWAVLAASIAAAAGAAFLVSQMFNEAGAAAAGASKKASDAAAAVAGTGKAAKDAGQEIAAATKQFEDLAAAGASLTALMRSPVEQLADEINRLDGMFAAGVINAETYARAMDKAKQALMDSEASAKRLRDIQAPQRAGAVERFTVAGFSAVNDGRGELQRLTELAKAQLEIEKRQQAALDEANRLAKERKNPQPIKKGAFG